MKNYIYILLGIFFPLNFMSCDKNDIPVYDANYTALNIWFGTEAIITDSTVYNYSYTLGEDSVMFYARITGLPTNEDRTFTLEAYAGDLDEAAGSYHTLTYTFKAGECLIECPIYFDTSLLNNPDSFTETDGNIYFRVAENPYFSTGANNQSSLHVILRNYLAKPDEWDSATYPYRSYADYFGEYSRTKYQFMIQTLGLVDFRILTTATTPYDEETNTVSTNYASYMADQMKQALAEYNATYGELRDPETNNPVTF